MNQTIKAIETIYKGYRFRSRLEARWAVFFDSVGIAWKYEHEGYEIKAKGVVHRYLPDFWLPDLGWIAEVKGDPNGFYNDREMWCALAEDIDHISDNFRTLDAYGVLMLGDVPEPASRVFLRALTKHSACLSNDLVEISMSKDRPFIRVCGGVDLSWIRWVSGLDVVTPLLSKHFDDPEAWSFSPVRLTMRRHWPKVENGYAKARHARFEHGENRG